MRSNLDLTYGALFSQRVLLALVETGLTRDDADRVVQRLAQQAIDERTALRDLLAGDPAGAALDLDSIFDYAPFVRYADEIVGRLDAIVSAAEPALAREPGRGRVRGSLGLRRERCCILRLSRDRASGRPASIATGAPHRTHRRIRVASDGAWLRPR